MTALAHRPFPRTRFVLHALVVAATTMIAAGCGGEHAVPTAPSVESPALTWGGGSPPATAIAATTPYPLALGNRWHYLSAAISFLVEQPGDVTPLGVIESDVRREIVGLAPAAGNAYLVLRETTTPREPGTVEIEYVSGLRQDALGLYEWDGGFGPTKDVRAASSSQVAARASAIRSEIARLSPAHARKLELLERYVLRAPASGLIGPVGPAPGELLRLRYPLRPRSTWVVRALDFGVLRATVIGRAAFRTPGVGVEQAWKLRYSWPGVYGPDDVVELWYGKAGYLGMHAELRTTAVDEGANVIGMLVTRLEEVLLEAELQEPPQLN